uniref:Uncharacterized protein n=1 Tax=Anguilla anguilla TaxID=7936 RepID=A0A0E9VH12_ANGAN
MAGLSKFLQEHSDNSSRKSQKIPEEDPKNCRATLAADKVSVHASTIRKRVMTLDENHC